MAGAPSTTSLRGQVTKYFFYRDDWFNGPEGSYTKDEDSAGDGEYNEVAGYVTGCFAGDFWSYNSDPGDTEELLCMTYNPITDHYSIREGGYVL